MTEYKNCKIISDLIHKYIKITEDVETVINKESFQRLKHIRQTTSYHLYPSTNHTRFEHSLGVMKLAIDFYDVLRPQLIKKYREECESDIENKINKNRLHLIFAALLHDVGHAPLSHLDENFYCEYEIKEKISDEITKKINGGRKEGGLKEEVEIGKEKNDDTKNEEVSTEENKTQYFSIEEWKVENKHEWMSCLVIIHNFYDELKEIFFRKEKIEFEFEYIMRIITGKKYSDQSNYWDRNIIISIVNSDTIDVDKLDYLMRDNFMAGLVGPKIDIEGLLFSLIITEKKKLGFSKAGLSAIKSIVQCRNDIYLWICNHYSVIYTDHLIQECLKHMSELYKYKKIDSFKSEDPPEYINEKRLSSIDESQVQKLNKFYCKTNEYYEKDGIWKLTNNNMNKEEKIECLKLLNEDLYYLPYAEALNKDEYFSVDAILNRYVSDNEINVLLNAVKSSAGKDKLSLYSEGIISQLLNRNFLKPLWKTGFEFKDFFNKNIKSQSKRNNAQNYFRPRKGNDKSTKNINEDMRKIRAIICDKTKCRLDEVFLVSRKNKFYFETDLNKIVITSIVENEEETDKQIGDLVPIEKFDEYDAVSFYLYYYCDRNDREKKAKIKKALIDIMNNTDEIEKMYNDVIAKQTIPKSSTH